MIRAAVRAGGRVVGADALAAAVVLPVRAAAATGRAAVGALAGMARPDTSPGVLVADLSGDKRAALLTRTWRSWAAWFFASSLVVAWAIALGRTYVNIYGPVGAVLPLALLPLTAAKAFRAAVMHWMLRTGQTGIRTYLRQPAEWVPPSEIRGVALLAAAVAALGAPAAVCAAAVAGGTTGTLAQQIIDALIPTDGATGLTVAIGALSSTVMWIGVSGLTLSAVTTVVAAAERGQVLVSRDGGRVGFFAPITMTIGMAMVIPTSSGLPVIDATVVRQLAVASDWMADKSWSAFVTSVTSSQGSPPPGIPAAVGGDTLAEEALRSATCAALVAERAGESGVTVSAVSSPAAGGAFVRTGTDADDSGVQVWSWTGCGGVSVPVPASSSGQALTTYSTARIAAVDALVQAVQSSGLAGQVAGSATANTGQTMPTAVLSELAGAAAAYDKAMVTASGAMVASQQTTARRALAARAAADGWLNAGAYWRSMAQLQSQAVQLASQAPAWHPPASGDAARALGWGADTIKAVGDVLAALSAEIGRERGAGSTSAQDLTAVGDGDGDSVWSRLTGPLDKRLTAAMVNIAKSDGTDPMADDIAAGAVLLTAGQAGLIAGVPVAMAAGSLPGRAVGADTAFDWAAPVVRILIGMCLAAGWILEYLLPILPWISMLWLGVSWIISIGEVLVFAQLWSVMLIKLDAKEFCEQAWKPGLAVMFNFAMRPVLGVLGLVLSYYSLPLAMSIVNKYFAAAYIGQQGGNIVGLFGVAGGVLLMSYLQWQVIGRVLLLVHSVPDRLPQWLGMHVAGMGGDEATTRTVGGAVATGGQAGRAAGGGNGGGGNGGGPKPPGGGAPGVRPVGGEGAADGLPAGALTAGQDAGHGGEAHWTRAAGGVEGLTAGQRQAAESAYASWAADNPAAAARHGLDDYVGYVQQRQAAASGAMVTDYD